MAGLAQQRELSAANTAYYFERFGFIPPGLIAEMPHPNLGMVVVIPCFIEPRLLDAVNSLWRCTRPECAVEVIVVVNSGEEASNEIVQQNQRTLAEARDWAREDCDRYFRIHFLDKPGLPRKHAGVGLARKIGMDEALYRLGSLNRLDAPMVCFDADSTCDENYFVEIEKFFAAEKMSPGCSIYFEHPLEGSEGAEIYQAITLYELHLRYYVEGLRFAGFPHAFHTVGSSMAVRADAYMRQGGMNRRQAGEDFYFLHKIIPLGNFAEINSTRVIPSPRASDRVPFGTGRAVREFLESGKMKTYPLEAFRDLKQFFAETTKLREPKLATEAVRELPAVLSEFLAGQKIEEALEVIRSHTNTAETFRDRFFRWFDGFRAMKYIHHARDQAYGAGEIEDSARRLIGSGRMSARELLLEYRAKQRENQGERN